MLFNGRLLTKALLLHNATVYIAGRSQEKADSAIAKLKEQTANQNVHFLKLDLADINSVVSAAKSLMSRETQLDILFNIAYQIHRSKLIFSGVMNTPKDAKTIQGYELQWVISVQRDRLI